MLVCSQAQPSRSCDSLLWFLKSTFLYTEAQHFLQTESELVGWSFLSVSSLFCHIYINNHVFERLLSTTLDLTMHFLWGTGIPFVMILPYARLYIVSRRAGSITTTMCC